MYNAKNYLRKCIDSLIQQHDRLSNMEILLIDDGSTDGSGEICDKYEKYEYIDVFHTENGGAAKARNFGMQKAKGKYIVFVDSDDYIINDSLIRIVNDCINQEEPDLMFLFGKKVFEDGKIVPIEDELIENEILKKTKESIISYLATRNKFQGSPCLKMVKRDLLIKEKLEFPEGKRVEDLDWCLQVLLKANSYGVSNADYYMYRQNVSNSNSNSFGQDSYSDFKDIINKWIDYANVCDNIIIKDAIYKFSCYEYCILLMHSYRFLNSDLEWHKSVKSIFKYANGKKEKVIKLMIKILGYKNTSLILETVYKRYNK